MQTLQSLLQRSYPTRIRQQQVLSLLESHGDPGKEAWRHLDLRQKVQSDSLMDRVSFYNEWIVQPIGTLIFWFIFLFAPSVLERLGIRSMFTGHHVWMTVLTATQTFWRAYQHLLEWEDHQESVQRFRLWHAVTHANGGPYIMGPVKYFPLIYADAVARITRTLRSMLNQTSS